MKIDVMDLKIITKILKRNFVDTPVTKLINVAVNIAIELDKIKNGK